MIKSLDHLADEANKGNQIEILTDGLWRYIPKAELSEISYVDLIKIIENERLRVKQIKG